MNQCPVCKSPAYIGFSVVECSNAECRNYKPSVKVEIAPRNVVSPFAQMRHDLNAVMDDIVEHYGGVERVLSQSTSEQRHPQQIVQGPRVLHKTPLGDFIGYDYPLFSPLVLKPGESKTGEAK